MYARVSLDEKADDRRFQDPENQLRPLRDMARALNYEVIGEYIDKASGANPNRPEFRRLLHDASMLRFNGVLIWKLDRFSREGIIPTISYIKRLKDRSVFLKSLTESWLDTADGGITDLVLAVMSWASAEERRKISERTKAGIAQRRAIGQWKGGRPRKLPDIKDVCYFNEDRWYCKRCGEIQSFKDLKQFQSKWKMHCRRNNHDEKGGSETTTQKHP